MSTEEVLHLERIVEDIREKPKSKVRITTGFTDDVIPLEVFVAQEWLFKPKGSSWEKTNRRIVIPNDVAIAIGRFLQREGVL